MIRSTPLCGVKVLHPTQIILLDRQKNKKRYPGRLAHVVNGMFYSAVATDANPTYIYNLGQGEGGVRRGLPYIMELLVEREWHVNRYQKRGSSPWWAVPGPAIVQEDERMSERRRRPHDIKGLRYIAAKVHAT